MPSGTSEVWRSPAFVSPDTLPEINAWLTAVKLTLDALGISPPNEAHIASWPGDGPTAGHPPGSRAPAPPGRRRSGASRPAGWRERCGRSAAGSACRRLQDGEEALQGDGIETRTDAKHALAGQEEFQAAICGRVKLGRAVGTDVDGHEEGAGGQRRG